MFRLKIINILISNQYKLFRKKQKGGTRMADIKFLITQELGVLGEGSKGWQKEINLISWNDRKAKLDIRDWGPEHERMGKGVTLSKAEAKELKHLLQDLDLDAMDIG